MFNRSYTLHYHKNWIKNVYILNRVKARKWILQSIFPKSTSKLLQYKMDSGTGNEAREQEKHGGGGCVSSDTQRGLWVKSTTGVQVG